MTSNIDFWKEKADKHITSHKEMLEKQTKLHVELEQKDSDLQYFVMKVKQMADEIEVLQR